MDKKQRGQGVIEYAGAIVAASMLVAVVMTVGPAGVGELFSDVLAGAQQLLNGSLDSLSS
jgi:hypothetical protein